MTNHQHLLWRAGFGPSCFSADPLNEQTARNLWVRLWKDSQSTPPFLEVVSEDLKSLVVNRDGAKLSEEERKSIREQNRDNLKQINLLWFQHMVDSPQQLREKMSFFWHGHFACRSLNSWHQQQLLDVIRTNALGNFGTLLREVSKSAAMLNFLNNNQNRKGHPNENFAREVMELFTLGRGNYSEDDIKEAARAFTGWGNKPDGEFVFRKAVHDSGRKNILGKQGYFDGDDVLDMLLQKEQTAVYITRKIYRFLVNEKPDENIIQKLSGIFFKANYEMAPLLDAIFTSSWFYNSSNIGTKIKSPIELLVGIQRALPLKLQFPEMILTAQRILGQVLFYPPNVAGWPGGENWIDSSTLMFRMRLPQLMTMNEVNSIQPKDDDDQMMGMSANSKKNIGYTSQIDWNLLGQSLKGKDKIELVQNVKNYLLQSRPSFTEEWVNQKVVGSNQAEWLRSAMILFMSTPEYQLC